MAKKKDPTTEYWKQAVKDYISCYTDEEVVSEEQLDKIAQCLMGDDEMWEVIDSTMHYHITNVAGNVLGDKKEED